MQRQVEQISTRSTRGSIFIQTGKDSCYKRLVYSAAVVHLPHVHQLLAPALGDGLRVRLVGEGLERGLDGVHGVLGPRDDGRDVVDAGGAAHLEEAGGDAETEAW